MIQNKTDDLDFGQEIKLYLIKVGSASLEEVCRALVKESIPHKEKRQALVKVILDAYVETGMLTRLGSFYYYK